LEDTSVAANEGEPAKDPTYMIHSATDAQAFLLEESIIGTDKELDMGMMVGALVHISLNQDVPMVARNAVHSVTLILDQLKMEAACHTLVRMVEKWVDTLAGRAIERVSELLKAAVESTTPEFNLS